MEHICVYSQRISRGEPKLPVGEDALPFANESGMFVADGLSGAAALRVDQLPEELFDPQTMADKICEMLPDMPGFTDRHDRMEAFCAYLKENFASLCNQTMRDIYRDVEKNIGVLKKSGYIASHVLGAVMCYLLNCIEADPSEGLLKNAEDIRMAIPELFMKLIAQLKIRYHETSLNRMEPFSSTLSTVLYKENETGVDAVFLNCGDSRSYILDIDGLRQAADDQGRNGGKTSMVSYKRLLDYGHIEISLEEKHFRKPCILISMSDGVYGTFIGESGFGSSPLYMEGVLLGQLANADSYDALRTNLNTFFDHHGYVDDSNSAAIAFFGFENYEAVREFARKRQEKMFVDYDLKEMPRDIFTVDYAAKCRGVYAAFVERNRDLLQKIFEEPDIYNLLNTETFLAGNPELKAELRNRMGENEGLNQCTELKVRQQKLFRDYMSVHLREISPESTKHEDVRKNGWN